MPEYVANLWSLARDGWEPDPEEESRALAMLDHPEFYALWEFEDDLPDEICGINPRLHIAIHQIGENQLRQNNPHHRTLDSPAREETCQ